MMENCPKYNTAKQTTRSPTRPIDGSLAVTKLECEPSNDRSATNAWAKRRDATAGKDRNFAERCSHALRFSECLMCVGKDFLYVIILSFALCARGQVPTSVNWRKCPISQMRQPETLEVRTYKHKRRRAKTLLVFHITQTETKIMFFFKLYIFYRIKSPHSNTTNNTFHTNPK